ncbi:glycosyltransferase family 2 protein [Caldimonas thermodepolymerans]|uniref:Glycosyl transferase family 2 n=1 Tax=Caldimonas thermodepolymerans TaxID=215580 RepID=A0AA46DBT2_9BURK|nr:glycosyltransferase family 2 protein [Caldimonas thermodepolymerans]TCP05769.1 glycosyl transferase family 2 [Caldimonas thermodepolymerans]UZG48288.1 glycosyltransferase [Caldimonas thermodepolymerans]
MLNGLPFLWHCLKSDFARALALAAPWTERPKTDPELWAMYRLGMYASVAQAHPGRLGWRGAFAKAVSHAACGEVEQSREAQARFLQQRAAAIHQATLADALVPFLPADALQLIEGLRHVRPALRVATLLRNGETAAARELLAGLPDLAFRMQPELHLFWSNAYGGNPQAQLERLNAFLARHGVAPLRLLDPARPPSPVNVVPAHPPAPVDGPLVSILMTTFRTGRRATTAIESVLAQSYRNLELIVVDDASDDETPALVEALASRDSRLQFIRLPHNVGTYVAKTIGLGCARGEFVTCHDSDDWSHPEKIARQVAPLLKDDGLVCTVSNWVRMQDDGLYYARPVHPLMRLNPSSPLFRRGRVLRDAGAWDAVRTGADSEFLARLKLVFGRRAVRKVALPLALGSHRPDSLMTAATTGYSETGISPQRLAYWEAWSRWHIESLAAGRAPFMPDMLTTARQRPFSAPDRLPVPPDAVEACCDFMRHCLRDTGGWADATAGRAVHTVSVDLADPA